MDIEKALAEEHSKAQTMRIVKYIGDDKIRFKKLIDIFLNGEYRMTQRASWPLSYAACAQPRLVTPYLGRLIKKLYEPDLHPALPRNILRIFEEIEIPAKHHGALVDICMRFIHDARMSVAIRAFSMTVAARICRQYPELKRELMLMFDEMRKYPQQPAIQSRLRSASRLLVTSV